MAITTIYGNEVELISREGSGVMTFGEIVRGRRTVDGSIREYRAGMDLRAPDGLAEIAAVVEALPQTAETGAQHPDLTCSFCGHSIVGGCACNG